MRLIFALLLAISPYAHAAPEDKPPSCGEVLDDRKMFEMFYAFFHTLPPNLQASVESYGAGHGFASKEEMNTTGQWRPIFSLLVHDCENGQKFSIDPSVTEPTLRGGKVLLPKMIGRYTVYLARYTPH